MAIAITNRLEEADTTGGDPVTTTGTVTTVAGRLYLVTVLSSLNVAVTSVTLPGSLGCTAIGSSTRGSLLTITWLWAIASGGSTGTVTVDFASATTGTVVIVDEVTGHHATTPIVAGSFVPGNGASATTATVTLAAFADATNNAGFFASALNGNVTITPEAGGTPWTELGQGGHTVPTRQLMTQWRTGGADLSPSSTFAASQWAAGGFEIAVAAGGTEIFGAFDLQTTAGIAVASKKDAKAATATPITANVAVAAKKDAKAATAVPLTANIVTAAKKDAHAAFALPLTLHRAVASTKTAVGATAVPILFTVDTSGEVIVPGEVTGAFALPVTFGVTVAARKDAHAATAVPLTLGVTTAAVKTAYAATATPIVLTITTNGQLGDPDLLDAVRTGWVAGVSGGGYIAGAGANGRIRQPVTGSVA